MPQNYLDREREVFPIPMTQQQHACCDTCLRQAADRGFPYISLRYSMPYDAYQRRRQIAVSQVLMALCLRNIYIFCRIRLVHRSPY